jgi:hypothetical protein
LFASNHHSANKQYHPFRANHGFCEVRFAPMSGHRETQSPSPKSAITGSRRAHSTTSSAEAERGNIRTRFIPQAMT